MHVREANPSDAMPIARVHVDSWNSTYSGILPAEYLDKLQSEPLKRRWEQLLSDETEGNFAYVAVTPGGEVAGFASGGPSRSGDLVYSGEVTSLYLLAEYQGFILGRFLLSAVAEHLVRRGLRSVMLWVLEENPARLFFEALGGKPVYDKEIVIAGTRLREVGYGWQDTGTLVLPPRLRQG